MSVIREMIDHPFRTYFLFSVVTGSLVQIIKALKSK